MSNYWDIAYYTRCFLGNAGGYLGLFLGYAVLNVPELLQEAFNWIYTNWNARNRIGAVGSGPPRASRIPIRVK